MRSIFCVFALAGVLAAGLACNPQLRQAEIKALETREMDLPFDESYQAAMNGLFSLGFTIDHSDKESGVVTGKRHDPNTGGKIGAALALGLVGLLAAGDRDEAVTFMLSRITPDLTQLRIKVLVNGKAVADRTMMTKIWQQIEREAMMESRPSDARPPAEKLATTAPAGADSG